MGSTVARSVLGIATFLVAVASCQATPVAVSPAAQSVDVEKGDPGSGAKEIGPIEVAHGGGCGGFGDRGAYESAVAMLRNKANAMGGNYVRVMMLTEPHSENGCFDNRFIIRGTVFLVTEAPAAARVTQVSADGCSPPCSPGYACQASECRALCNPACAPGEICRRDRTCGPASP
jgi:hypothetical protein